MKIAVTGATGFVGFTLCARLLAHGLAVVPCVRRAAKMPNEVVTGDLSKIGSFDWQVALENCNAIVHLAARVHVMNEKIHESLSLYRAYNTEATLTLARHAARVGVRRFIYISSIKVNGEETKLGVPFSADNIPAPVDPYGISKLEAEDGLIALAAETGMEVVIIRPVLVYGPGVKGNFFDMMSWLDKGIPLPLGAIHNKRSLVALDNLIDLIVTCIDHPKAGNQIFLVSDGEDMSTTDLLRRMGRALGKSTRLVPIPLWMLVASAKIFGKRAIAQRLCGSLQVDIQKTHKLLGWRPPKGIDSALHQTAEYFLAHKKDIKRKFANSANVKFFSC